MVQKPASVIESVRERWPVLPPLELRGVGTSLVESLPSYVSRMLTTTGVGAAHLADSLGLDLPVKLRRLGAFLTTKDSLLMEGAVDQLERLTGARNLRLGTFWALSAILAAVNQSTQKKAPRRWCSICYREWGIDSYEPLAWTVDLLRTCPKHGCLLSSTCPSCGRPQRSCLSERHRRLCHTCRADLGAAVTWGGLHPFLQWVEDQVLDLIEFCATPRVGPVPYDVFKEFVQGLHRTIGGRRGGSLGQQVKQCATGARLRGKRVSMRSLINLCAVQGVRIGEFLAAPRETSGPMLFDAWGGLSYMPLPTPRQAQKIYAASRCLKDFLRVRPTYLPPISLLLGRMHVQLLAIRDVAEEAYDFYEDAYSVQGDEPTQRKFRSAYLNAMSAISAEKLCTPNNFDRIVGNVVDRTGVVLAVAKHAVRSAIVVREVWADALIERYEREMPVEAAVEWFVQNRRCSWSGTK